MDVDYILEQLNRGKDPCGVERRSVDMYIYETSLSLACLPDHWASFSCKLVAAVGMLFLSDNNRSGCTSNDNLGPSFAFFSTRLRLTTIVVRVRVT